MEFWGWRCSGNCSLGTSGASSKFSWRQIQFLYDSRLSTTRSCASHSSLYFFIKMKRFLYGMSSVSASMPSNIIWISYFLQVLPSYYSIERLFNPAFVKILAAWKLILIMAISRAFQPSLSTQLRSALFSRRNSSIWMLSRNAAQIRGVRKSWLLLLTSAPYFKSRDTMFRCPKYVALHIGFVTPL